MIHADFALARRIESTEMMMNAAAIEKESELRPATGAEQLEIAGGRAFFMGADSPLTQAIGMGMNGAVSAEQMDTVEEFFSARGAASNFEVCPLADHSLRELLAGRGYQPIEFSSALYRSLEAIPSVPDGFEVRPAGPTEIDLSTRIIVEGFFGAEPPPGMFELCSVMSHSGVARNYLAWKDGAAIAGGALGFWKGTACLFGDGTPERMRGRGGQSALIAGRLAAAKEAGCDLAMAYTMCGSTSQRNYERAGFCIAYTRTKWTRALQSEE
jgi:hypothetical protein